MYSHEHTEHYHHSHTPQKFTCVSFTDNPNHPQEQPVFWFLSYHLEQVYSDHTISKLCAAGTPHSLISSAGMPPTQLPTIPSSAPDPGQKAPEAQPEAVRAANFRSAPRMIISAYHKGENR